ncbi:unnamed protein product [Meloidogyne enterolobii]|uniref:Uncharacterized protein n=1 Tax=Meloidogyne enterolobii TaxID=390850 RepID=A0ACB0ZY41_MELEN
MADRLARQKTAARLIPLCFLRPAGAQFLYINVEEGNIRSTIHFTLHPTFNQYIPPPQLLFLLILLFHSSSFLPSPLLPSPLSLMLILLSFFYFAISRIPVFLYFRVPTPLLLLNIFFIFSQSFFVVLQCVFNIYVHIIFSLKFYF